MAIMLSRDRREEVQLRKKRNLSHFKVTDEEINLAIAWAKDEISLGQFSKVMWNDANSTTKGVGGKALYTIAVFLKAGIIRNKITVKK